MNSLTPPVLIVGAGPVGQLAALMLSRQGIRSRLIDKRLETLTAPKAHAVNARTLEICEGLGVSAERLRALGACANDAGHVRFVGTLTGPEFGALPYERQDEDAFRDTPFPLTNIPQPLFESELQEAIKADPLITFERGIECTALENRADSVMAGLRRNGDNDINFSAFDYVVVADGAGSRLRDALGITMQGPEVLDEFLMIHFSADLRPYTEGRRGVLYFLLEPGVRGALIAYDHSKTWVLMHPWNKAEERLEDYTDERCRELINQAVGQPVAYASIENISPWTMTAQIAEHYQVGRCFLVGDAAHRFPPAGGLGLNTGASDAQNLTWKLAAVLNHQAGPTLLDTYETERQPVARTNSEQSLTNAAKIFDLIVAIHGIDPEKAGEHYREVAADPANFPALADAVEAQKPHFDSFALQLGYRYHSPALIDPPEVPAVPDVSDYQPSWDVGAHFPHYWIDKAGKRVPLQHFLPDNQFSLLLGPQAAAVVDTDWIHTINFASDLTFEQNLEWTSLTGLPDSGALLIRPDGHIAAHLAQTDDINAAMDQILARGAA